MSKDKSPYDAFLTELPARVPTEPRKLPEPGFSKAVALKHTRGSDEAPRVVATGRGAVAEQILELAFANNVKVREDAQLVEILELLEVDSPIPLEAFAAVAEILAYVYRANAKYRSHGA